MTDLTKAKTMPDAPELEPYARLHVESLSGPTPLTAYLTEPGGVYVYLDSLDIKIKAATSATVKASGGPEKFLLEFWPEAEFEFPPFDPNWVSKRPAIDSEEAPTLIGA